MNTKEAMRIFLHNGGRVQVLDEVKPRLCPTCKSAMKERYSSRRGIFLECLNLGNHMPFNDPVYTTEDDDGYKHHAYRICGSTVQVSYWCKPKRERKQ